MSHNATHIIINNGDTPKHVEPGKYSRYGGLNISDNVTVGFITGVDGALAYLDALISEASQLRASISALHNPRTPE